MKNSQQRASELQLIMLFSALASILVVIFGGFAIEHMLQMHKDSQIYLYIFLFMSAIVALHAYVYIIVEKYNKQISLKEQELLESNIRLEYAINGSGDGLWDWNLVTNEIYFSPRWKGMLGYSDDEMPNSFTSWSDNVHPDDLQMATNAILAAQASPNVEYNIEARLRHKNGHWVWILDRGQTIFNEDGTAVRMVGFHTDISEQKRLQEDLKNSRELFIKFMEHMPANIYIIDKQIVVYSNKTPSPALETQNFEGYRIDELFPQEKATSIHKTLERVSKDGYYEDIVTTINHLGEEKIYREFAFKIEQKDHFSVGLVSIDITKEYKSNAQIKRVLSAFERSNVSVVMTDLAGDIEYVNPSWCRITGYSKEELLGQNPRMVKSGYVSDETYRKMWDHLTHGKVWNSEIKNVAKDGTEFWEDSTIMPSFDKDDNINGYIAFKVEINEKMRLKQELAKQEEMMLVQSRHAAMGEMISMIAHQWRQPISVIAMNAANILVDVELEILDLQGLKEVSNEIIEQTQELSKTIDDFRDFFKPNKVSEEILLQKVVDDTLGVIGKSLSNNGITLQVNIPNELLLNTYARELMQVLLNLLKNAKEAFNEESSYEKLILLDAVVDGTHVKINVRDNAGGIDEKIIHKVFEPYFTTKDVKNGTGLGLYICKTIVEKHLQGLLRVENVADGALFSIDIPLRIQND